MTHESEMVWHGWGVLSSEGEFLMDEYNVPSIFETREEVLECWESEQDSGTVRIVRVSVSVRVEKRSGIV